MSSTEDIDVPPKKCIMCNSSATEDSTLYADKNGNSWCLKCFQILLSVPSRFFIPQTFEEMYCDITNKEIQKAFVFEKKFFPASNYNIYRLMSTDSFSYS